MSAGQTTQQDRYGVICVAFTGRPWFVVDASGSFGVEADRYLTESAARHAARMLNAGVARVDSHAIVGCKVVAS